MNLNDYLIDHSTFDWATLLKEWRWLLPPQFGVWLFTRAGDLFISLPDGTIHILDVGSGELRQVAESVDDACNQIDDPEVAEEWLMIPIVDDLVAAGHVLGPDQCYGFKVLPLLGGGYDAENRAVLPVSEYFGASGSLLRQLSDVPDGAQVQIKTTE